MIRQFDIREQHRKLGPQLMDAFEEVLYSGQYILGETVEAFEYDFEDFTGAEAAAGVASGTDALMLALQAVGVGQGDHVIAPGFTFVASVTAAMNLGATVTLADIEPDTYCISERTVAEVFQPGVTKAIIAVHMYGHPAPIDELLKFGVPVIEDAAQATGSEWKGVKAGALGDLAAFSFFPTKTLGALGDGGMVTGSEQYVSNVRMLRAHGSKVKYKHEILGRNSRLDALQAAFLSVKLEFLGEWLEARARIAGMYSMMLIGNDHLEIPTVAKDGKHSWHQYTVRVLDRDNVRKRMLDKGVEASVHYPMTVADQDF